jgi:hypothetical protein
MSAQAHTEAWLNISKNLGGAGLVNPAPLNY